MEIAGQGWSGQVQFRGRFHTARAYRHNLTPQGFSQRQRSYQISFFAHETQNQKTKTKMKKHVSYLCGAALFLGAALFNQSVQAQLTLTGTNYTPGLQCHQ